MSANRDQVLYLNHPDETVQPFYSRLLREIESSKQGKAPVSQWTAMIKAFVQKGIKQSEIEETGILERLAVGDQKQVMQREDLIKLVRSSQVTIKQVTLAQPQFAGYRWPGGQYYETLFIANSKRDNVADRIEAIEFDLEQINFDMDRLMDAITLDDERMRLKKLILEVPDFDNHHFSTAVNGKHGKNLLAHARYTIRGDVFFIEEIQSDWAQRWRKNEPVRRYHELIETGRTLEEVMAEIGLTAEEVERVRYRAPQPIPRGPLITNTELWTAMVLRRLMQMAARMPQVNQVAWITGSMRNGGQMVSRDNLGDFYAKIIPKLCEKQIGKLGKVTPREITLREAQHTVLGIDMSPELKEKLAGEMPLYAHGFALERDDADRALQQAKADALRERFAGKVGDIGTLQLVHGLLVDAVEPPVGAGAPMGRYFNGAVAVSLQAKHPEEVLDHEIFHVAYDRMLFSSERAVLDEAFAPGTALTQEVAALAELYYGSTARAESLRSREEAAAYAFSLWSHGYLKLSRAANDLFSTTPSIFERIRDAFTAFWRAIRGEKDRGLDTPAKIFDALEYGTLAHLRAQTPDDSADLVPHAHA